MLSSAKIKLCLLYSTTDEPYGGLNSFMKGLKKEFAKFEELELTEQESADVVIVSAAVLGKGKKIDKYQMRNIISGRRVDSNVGRFYSSKKLRVIHRLDGVTRLYGRSDDLDERQVMVNRFADYTIFQSKYCQESFKGLNVVPENWSIIGNGADTDIYSMKNDHALSDTLRLVASSWSDNPMKGHETIKNFSFLKGVKVTHIGRWPKCMDVGNVEMLGAKSQHEMGIELKKHDIFLHAAKNDPCPNVVYEALSTGLPVVYNTSGGTPEICGYARYGVPLGPNPEETLQEMKKKYDELVTNIRSDFYRFTIASSAKKYLEVIKKCVRST